MSEITMIEMMAELKLRIDELKRLIKNKPAWGPECESMLDAQGKCTNTQCNQNQRLL